jgi:hypothetical protein
MNERPRTSSASRLWLVIVGGLLLGCQMLFGGVHVEGTEEPVSTDGCNAGDYKCNGEHLLACASEADGWTLKNTCASGDRCDPKGKLCKVCSDGDFSCNGAIRRKCTADGSAWEDFERCASAEQCSEAGCGPCRPGTLDCSLAQGERRVLRECSAAQQLVELDVCENEALCTASRESSTLPGWARVCNGPVCEAGKYSCEGTRLRRCETDRSAWREIDVCVTTGLCDAASAEGNGAADAADVVNVMCPSPCAPGGHRCEGMSLQRCQADQSGFELVTTCEAGTECDPVLGRCGGPCSAGQYQCNGSMLRKCRANGTWDAGVDCLVPELCPDTTSAGPHACSVPTCTAGEFRCDGAVLSRCRADLRGFEPHETCDSPALCNQLSGRCDLKACPVAEEYRCEGPRLQRCNDDLTAWTPILTCNPGQFCDNDPADPGCKMECPRPLRCNGRVLERCTPQGWATQASCATAELCGCTLLDPDGAGPLTSSCVEGVATDGCGVVACGGSRALYRCQGAALQQCTAGRNGWDAVATCDAPALCYAGEAPTHSTGYCAGCPSAGELACSGSGASSALRQCAADRRDWLTLEACGAAGCIVVPNADDRCAACEEGEVRCAGAQPEICDTARSGFVANGAACSTSCLPATGACTACSAGDAQCDGAQPQVCNVSGRWLDEGMPCPAGADCLDGACQYACAAEARDCMGAQPLICAADRSELIAEGPACAEPALCTSMLGATRCLTCLAGERQCDGLQPQVCNATRTGWVESGDSCATTCLDSGVCGPVLPDIACEAGQYRCMGVNLQICNATLTDWDPFARCANANACDEASGTCTE